MKFRGINLGLNLPGRQNPWALFLLLFSIVSLFQGVTTTHWMASLRGEDSIIPHKDDLTRIGPFLMSKIITRNSILVGFARPTEVITYKEDTYGFDVAPSVIEDLISEYSGQPIAYLSVSKNRSLHEIWGCEVNGIEVLTYEKSVSNYKSRDYSRYSWFLSSIACAIWFLISIIDFRGIY